jgi:hypothetical protein
MRADDDDRAHQITIAAAMDRRDAEAVVLALRRCVKRLGIEGTTITVTPSRGDVDTPPNAGGDAEAPRA